jgi:NAD(P)-dependent dehydrogenase (short-subunit alcohol dehydrogenase family)
MQMGSLSGKVVVVTGASRGVGRGIAIALGAEGASVYVTGRTVAAGSHPLPGTVGETAAEVSRRGGNGIAVPVDLAEDDQIAALFERVRREQGRLDILVNNAIAYPPTLTERKPFFEKPLANWDTMIDIGLRSYFVAAWHAAQIMVPQKSGLIAYTSGYIGASYNFSLIFGVCKTAVDRMARDMAIELKPYNVASISFWQGFTFTERTGEALKTVSGIGSQLHSNSGSSAEFPGRVIAAVARDPNIMRHTGGSLINAELAQEYGITDIDGRVVPSLRAERGAPLFSPI